jgi:hypothetical protein
MDDRQFSYLTKKTLALLTRGLIQEGVRLWVTLDGRLFGTAGMYSVKVVDYYFPKCCTNFASTLQYLTNAIYTPS